MLRAIIVENVNTWADVRDKSGLTHQQMFKAVRELQNKGVLRYDDKVFQVTDDELSKAYEAVGQTVPQTEPVKPVGHAEWIQKWIDMYEINASLTNHHFFIEGSNLAELTRALMERAGRNLIVVNPFVDGHRLGTTLRDAAKRGVEVTLVTRRPQQDKKRWAFHKTLLSEGVDMYYSGDKKGSGGAHSKLTIVDEEVAIASSMNFTKNSEVEAWETGIVTVEKNAVDSALDSIRNLKSENETSSAKNAHK